MPFKDLDHMDLPDFLHKERDDSALWVFMHIPKTAGSSFSVAMAETLTPYKNIEIDYSDNSKDFVEKINESVNSFIKESTEIKYRSASGHITYDLILKIRRSISNVKLVTFLRDPVARVISDYRYQRTPMHPPYREFIKQFPEITDYLNAPVAQNGLAKYICGRGVMASADDAIQILDNEFSFVGLQEMYPLSYYSMMEIFGATDVLPAQHHRKTPDTEETKLELTSSIIEMIRDKNSADVEIFDHVRNRLLKHREKFSSRL